MTVKVCSFLVATAWNCLNYFFENKMFVVFPRNDTLKKEGWPSGPDAIVLWVKGSEVRTLVGA